MRWPSLHAPATIADVIGWTTAVPVALFGLLTLPSMAHLPSKFRTVLQDFGEPPTWQLKSVFALHDAGLVALIVAIALGPLVAVSAAGRSATKVIVPVCGAIALVSLYWFVLGSVFEEAARLMAAMPASR